MPLSFNRRGWNLCLNIVDGNVLGAPAGWKIVGRGVSKTVEIGKRGRPAVCITRLDLLCCLTC